MLGYCKYLAPMHWEWTTAYDLDSSTGNQSLFYFIIHHFIILINRNGLKKRELFEDINCGHLGYDTVQSTIYSVWL